MAKEVQADGRLVRATGGQKEVNFNAMKMQWEKVRKLSCWLWLLFEKWLKPSICQG